VIDSLLGGRAHFSEHVVRLFLNPAIVGVSLAMARLASAQDGPANVAEAPRTASTAPTASSAPAVPPAEAIRLDEYLNRLDAWRNEGRITAAEAARARRLLNAAIVGGDRSVRVPLDASGRIDLLALARGQTGIAGVSAKPEERLVSRILNEFDIRMQAKARDLATPGNLVLFEGAYTAVPTRDLGRIVRGALETTPIGELPFGSQIVEAIGVLPNTTGVTSGQTFREVSKLVGDRERDWMESGVGRIMEGHKVEGGLLAFGAITALRMASPGAARFMDGLGVRLRVWQAAPTGAHVYSSGRLVYRSAHPLPDLELEAGTRHVSGPTTFRLMTTASVGADVAYRASGRMGIGTRWQRGSLFADTNATCGFPEHLARTEVRVGYLAETGLAISGAVAATFGHGSGAVGPAPGRLGFELDLTKPLLVGGAPGETSLFVSSGADSDLAYADWRGGLVFRLRF